MLIFASCSKKREDEIIVFAPSSLTEVVTKINQEYEKEKKIKGRLNFAGSKTLRTQLENGAVADIFISANKEHYTSLVDKDIVKEGRELVTNDMIVIVAKKEDLQIKSLKDLTTSHHLVLADEKVPAGDYGRKVLHKLTKAYGEDYERKVLENLVSLESNVRQVVTKVALKEADVGIVYRTDISEEMKKKVDILEIPTEYNVIAKYYIGVVNQKEIAKTTYAYYDNFFTESSKGIYKSYGFGIVE